jgi:hypothetical protein
LRGSAHSKIIIPDRNAFSGAKCRNIPIPFRNPEIPPGINN